MKPHIKQFFEFLEKKEKRKVPIEVKLLSPKEYKITPEDLNVKGDLKLSRTSITSLPNNLTVGRHLYLRKSKVASLPNNLTVGHSLWSSTTPIKSLPDNLKVGGDLYLINTPLSEKYTEEQIRSMIEEKGGHVNKEIYI